ncbi:MAG: potassium channel family protein [Kiloniellales bacterium]
MTSDEPEPSSDERSLRQRLQTLYHGNAPASRSFRYGLIAFDVFTIGFFIVSSVGPEAQWVLVVDVILGFLLLLEFIARAIVLKGSLRFFLSFGALVDLIVIASLMAPLIFENLAFLRVVRMLRLLRSYHLLHELRQEWAFFRRNEEVIQSSINLTIFIFTVTAVVYVLEVDDNANINNYFDALYFTVSTLTTTGFGDITLTDTLGRALAVVIMVFGVGLFLRLVQTIFRPPKVAYRCPDCGLNRHDPDAIHCKHCGASIKIPTEGDWN